MFERVPNPLPGGNTHMITGKTAGTPSKAILPCFFLGNYSATDEKMALDMRLGAQVIEWGNVDRWAVANPIADGRLLTVGALRTKRACGPAPLAAADFEVGCVQAGSIGTCRARRSATRRRIASVGAKAAWRRSCGSCYSTTPQAHS